MSTGNSPDLPSYSRGAGLFPPVQPRAAFTPAWKGSLFVVQAGPVTSRLLAAPGSCGNDWRGPMNSLNSSSGNGIGSLNNRPNSRKSYCWA